MFLVGDAVSANHTKVPTCSVTQRHPMCLQYPFSGTRRIFWFCCELSDYDSYRGTSCKWDVNLIDNLRLCINTTTRPTIILPFLHTTHIKHHHKIKHQNEGLSFCLCHPCLLRCRSPLPGWWACRQAVLVPQSWR
jgi:hypothetical protein